MWKRPRLPSPTTRGQPLSMKGSNKRSFCPISTLSIPAMSMPSCCTGANRITELIWWVPHVLITNGRLSNRPDLTRESFRSIGKPNKRPARRLHQEQLDACHRQSQKRGHQDQILDEGLSMLPEPRIVYAIDASASHHHRS